MQVPPPSLFDKIVQTAELDHSTTAWLFQPVAGKSLVQLFHMLHQSIDKAFALPMVSILPRKKKFICQNFKLSMLPGINTTFV